MISVPDGAVAQVRDALPDPARDVKFSYIFSCWDALSKVPRVILAVDNDAPGGWPGDGPGFFCAVGEVAWQ